MTTIPELKQILLDFYNLPTEELSSERELSSEKVSDLIASIETNKTLGDLFLSLLKIVAGPYDITNPDLKSCLIEFIPILLLIKKINRPDLPINLEDSYQDAVDFFNKLNKIK